MEDYTSYYRSNFPFDPPRLEPFGPYGEPSLSRINVDEYPYMPDILFLGGNRANLARWRPWAGNTRPGPTWNENYRYTFQDDLSWNKGRHNMKFGFVTERDAKTEPGSATYTGSTTSDTAATIRSARATVMRTRCWAISRGTKSGPTASIASGGTGRLISMRRTASA